MSLFRTIVVLVGGVVLMLVVVILRAETTRLHYQTAQREQRLEDLREQLRQAEMELARLRNPMLIRERAREASQSTDDNAAPAPPAARRGERR
jgi:predicted Holliday junction resolvase-like endonuclease